MNYLSLQKVAIIRGNVIFIDKKSKLYAEDITYDLNNDVGQYLTGGKLINGESEITSQTGTFYTKENLILFRQNVKVNHPKYKLESDSLMYNTKEKRSIFKTSTKIENDSGFIWCNAGWHDEEKINLALAEVHISTILLVGYSPILFSTIKKWGKLYL